MAGQSILHIVCVCINRIGTDNSTYQREMAEQLVQSVGWHEAMEFAREYQWDGVMTHILALEPDRKAEPTIQ